jgi:hypothetical protein
MRYFITFLFFIYSWFEVYGQLDTIRLSEMKSDNVFIIADVEDLVKRFGMPSFIHENHQINCYRKFVYSIDKDTVFYFNLWTYTYYKNYKNRMSYIEKNGKVRVYENRMSYIEKNGRVRLTNFNFKINKKAVIYIPTLKLSRKLRLSELKRACQYTDEDIEKIT